MTALAITYRAPADLRGYDRNARTHSEAQIAQIMASIREYGFTNPLLVDDTGEIIAGHGRLAAATRLGLESVPTIVLHGLTPAQRRAYVLADNQIALNGGWDLDVLRAELTDLKLGGFDLDLTGFQPLELGDLGVPGYSPEPMDDPEEAPDPPANPVTILGDLWVLGDHRLICGDSTDADTVKALLGNVVPHLMVTDPPYGVEYDAAWRGSAKRSDGGRASLGVHAKGKVLNDDRSDWGGGMGALSRRGRLRLARGKHGSRRRRQPYCPRLQHPGPDHLEQVQPGHWARRLSPKA